MGRRIECICNVYDKCKNGGIDNDTKGVKLTFHHENILYDIKNYAYITSHAMPEDVLHIKHLIADIGEDGNVDRVARVLGTTHGYVMNVLSPIVNEDVSELKAGEIINDLWIPEEYQIDLTVPSKIKNTAVYYLAKLIHDLFVYRALWDWYSILYPDFAMILQGKIQVVEDELEEIVARLTTVDRRPLSPW